MVNSGLSEVSMKTAQIIQLFILPNDSRFLNPENRIMKRTVERITVKQTGYYDEYHGKRMCFLRAGIFYDVKETETVYLVRVKGRHFEVPKECVSQSRSIMVLFWCHIRI